MSGAIQNVNLYVPELRPTKEWLSFSTLIFISLGFFILLASVAMFSKMRLVEYEEQVVVLEGNVAAERENIELIKEKSPSNSGEKLDKKIEGLRGHVTNLSLVSELISSQNLGNEDGYSDRLKALASKIDRKVSLSKFRFSRGEKLVELSGSTVAPSALTQFVDALQVDASFEGAVFGSFTLRQQENKQNVHEFSLGYETLFQKANHLVEAQ